MNVVALDVVDGQIAAIRSMLNPDKLAHLGPTSDAGPASVRRSGAEPVTLPSTAGIEQGRGSDATCAARRRAVSRPEHDHAPDRRSRADSVRPTRALLFERTGSRTTNACRCERPRSFTSLPLGWRAAERNEHRAAPRTRVSATARRAAGRSRPERAVRSAWRSEQGTPRASSADQHAGRQPRHVANATSHREADHARTSAFDIAGHGRGHAVIPIASDSSGTSVTNMCPGAWVIISSGRRRGRHRLRGHAARPEHRHLAVADLDRVAVLRATPSEAIPSANGSPTCTGAPCTDG